MSSELHEPDLKNIWRNQETEKTTMSVEVVRRNARRLLRKKQRDLIGQSAFVLLAAVFCGMVLMSVRMTPVRLIAGLTMAALLMSTGRSLYRMYWRSSGAWHAVHDGANSAMTSCLEFYRGELERQREFARLPAWQMVTVLLIIAWLLRNELMRRSADSSHAVLPFVLFAAAGLIILMAVRKFQASRVQEAMDALNQFEEENISGGSDDAAIDKPKK